LVFAPATEISLV